LPSNVRKLGLGLQDTKTKSLVCLKTCS